MEKKYEVKEIEIKIKTLNSTTFPLSIHTNDTIKELKSKISAKLRIGVMNQRLIFQGKLLNNDNKIYDYKIEEGDVIHLVETDMREYRPPPQRATSLINDNNMSNGGSTTNNFLQLFLNQNSQSQRNNNANNERLRTLNAEGIFDSFHHLLFPNTFNLVQAGEVITQNTNTINEMIGLGSFFNLDSSATVKDLFNSQSHASFQVGQWVDFKNQNQDWIEGQIVGITSTSYKVYYVGFSEQMNEWVAKNSGRVALFRTYTVQDSKPGKKYQSAFPNKEISNEYGFQKANKFSCLTNDIILFLDYLKEKIVKIMRQSEMVKKSRFDSKEEFLKNEKYEILLQMQLYPIMDRIGRLLTDMSGYLMNTCYKYFTDNIFNFKLNIIEPSMRFMNIYDSNEVVTRNILKQYINLTKFSIITNKAPENQQQSDQVQQQPRIGYIVNIHSFSRTREQEREEQRRRQLRYMITRTQFGFDSTNIKKTDSATQTEKSKPKISNFTIDRNALKFEIFGQNNLIHNIGNDKEDKDKERELKNSSVKKSIIKEKISIQARPKNISSINSKKVSNNYSKKKYKLSQSKGKVSSNNL